MAAIPTDAEDLPELVDPIMSDLAETVAVWMDVLAKAKYKFVHQLHDQLEIDSKPDALVIHSSVYPRITAAIDQWSKELNEVDPEDRLRWDTELYGISPEISDRLPYGGYDEAVLICRDDITQALGRYVIWNLPFAGTPAERKAFTFGLVKIAEERPAMSSIHQMMLNYSGSFGEGATRDVYIPGVRIPIPRDMYSTPSISTSTTSSASTTPSVSTGWIPTVGSGGFSNDPLIYHTSTSAPRIQY